MIKKNQYGQDTATNVTDIYGAVVIDNCGTIRLKNGQEVIWAEGVNPEHNGTREFFNYEGEAITLPCTYQ